MLTLVTKCGPLGEPVWRVAWCGHDRRCICHKRIILSLIMFVSVVNLLSFSMFLEPAWNSSSNGLSRTRVSAATRLELVSNETVGAAKPPEVRSRSSMSNSRSAARAKALVAPRLDRLWPSVWTMEFQIDRPQICANFTRQPRAEPNWTAIVVVISAPSNFEQRSSVRETWGRSLKEIEHFRLVFFVGHSALNESGHRASLRDEAERYADLVQADFVDHYDNLTLKSVLMLRWVTTRCANAHFLLKVDDDVFVNPVNLGHVLDHYRAEFSRVIFGHLALRWQPIRDSRSPYFVSTKTWTAPEYPNFMAGPAYVVTMDSVDDLLGRVRSVPYFHLEDVYVTGMLAQVAGIVRFNQPGFVNRKFVVNPCVQRDAVTGHHLEADELRAAWDVHRRTMDSAAEQSEEDCYEIECKVQLFGLCLNTNKVPIDYYRYYYYDGRRSAAVN